VLVSIGLGSAVNGAKDCFDTEKLVSGLDALCGQTKVQL
jgi:hypothetical protein